MQKIITFFFLMSLAFAASAKQAIEVSNKNSQVLFSGEHAGMTFEGEFKQWHASLILPPHDTPSITAEFDLSSAETGDATYDSTLPEGDWFDVENHPRAYFNSTSIKASGNNYEVQGELKLRGISQKVEFLLIRKGKQYEANFDIDRLAYKIGYESDPEAEWVSQTISMKMLLLN